MSNRKSPIGNRKWIAAAVCVVSLIAGVAYTRTDRTASIRSSSLAARPSPEVRDTNVSSGEWQTVRMRVTGYCPCEKCCGDSADGITANGHRIQPGDTFVAADRRYAFGTEMIIPGYSNSQIVKVLDRGGAIRGDKLDAFFHTHQAALEWGVRYLDVQVRTK